MITQASVEHVSDLQMRYGRQQKRVCLRPPCILHQITSVSGW